MTPQQLIEYYAVTCAIAVFTFWCGWMARSGRLNAIHAGAIKQKDHQLASLQKRLEAAQRNLSPRN